MAFNSTSWTTDALSKAGATSTTTQSLTTGTLTANTLTLSENTIKDSAGDIRIFMDASANTVEVRNASFLIQNVSNDSPYPIIKSDPDNDLHSISLSGSGYGTDTLQIGRDDGGHSINIKGSTTWGVDDTGYDVKFYGATSGKYMLWDESIDSLELTDSTPLNIGAGKDMVIYHSGTHSYINNSTGTLNIATSESGIPVSIGHTTSETTVNDNLTITGDTKMTSGSKLFFDGTITTSGGTYITESSANVLDFYAGGVNSLRVDDDQVIVGTSQVHFTASSGTEMHWSADGAANLRALGGMYINTGTATGTPVKLGTNGQTDSLVIDSSENVEITGGNLTVSGGYLVEARTVIKIKATDFISNDDTGYAMTIIEDDESNYGVRPGNVGIEFYAYIDVPLGYTATKVKVNGSATAVEVEVYTLDLDDGTISSEISASGLTVGDDTVLDTNHVGADDKILLIHVVTTALDDIIYGGYVTVEAT